MSTFEILNKTIADTAAYYKTHKGKTAFCDSVKEFRNDDDHFISIFNQDVDIEEKLSQQLQTLIADSRAESTQTTKENIKLSLLCLNGHIAKLEHRRSYLTIALAMLALTLPLWAKKDLPESLLLIALTVICALPLWLVIFHIDKRIFLLKRTADHLKFVADHP